MRVLVVLLALVATPFVVSVAQAPAGSDCDNGLGDEHRSTQGQAHAHRGLCAPVDLPPPEDDPPPPPSQGCVVSLPPAAGNSAIDGKVILGVSPYTGLENWCVVLSGAVSATALTDAAGTYRFTGLPAGTYTVCEVLQSGWQQTFPSSGTLCPTGLGWTFTLNGTNSGSFVDFRNVQIQ